MLKTILSLLLEPDVEMQNSDAAQDKQKVKMAKSTPLSLPSFSNLSDDKDDQADGKFLDEFQALLDSHQTSMRATPFMSQLRNVNEDFRRSFKKGLKRGKSSIKLTIPVQV